MNKKHTAPVHQISLRVVKLSELFNSMDPTPFQNRDLDPDAHEFIESWAVAYPSTSHFRIHIHIVEMPAEDPTAMVVDAIHNYFSYKAEMTRRSLALLLREGRTSLLIGLGFLAACLAGADMLPQEATNPALRVLREGLMIVGWVAMWRPLQLFLYEWWPLARRIRILRSLSAASVHVVQA